MNELTSKEILKYRTQGTIAEILSLVNKIPEDELIEDLFVYTENEKMNQFIKMFEKQILLAKLNKEKFAHELNAFYRQTMKFIKKNNLYRDFLDFLFFIYIKFKKEKENTVLNIYINLLAQQFCYIVEPPYLCVGLTSNNKILKEQEVYPNIDVPLYLAKKHNLSKDKLEKLFKRFGYNIKDQEDFFIKINTEQMITINRIKMSPLINETNTEFIVKNPSVYLITGFNIPNIQEDISDIKEKLRLRRCFLPKSGLKLTFNNAKLIKEIILKETYYYSDIVLLYKIILEDDGEMSGYYYLKEDLFWSIWLDAHDGMYYHNNLEKWILYIYTYFITDIKENMIKFKKEFNSEDKSIQVIVTDNQGKHFNKNEYYKEVSKVLPHIRKLPVGATASESAIQLAKEYGIYLKEGETFVRPFEKIVYKKTKK